MPPMTRARSLEGISNENTPRCITRNAPAQGSSLPKARPFPKPQKAVMYIPGLYTPQEEEGWKKVMRAVHEKGTKLFTQLWHVGRISHTSIQLSGMAPVGPSDIQANSSNAWGLDENEKEGFVPCSKPRALSTNEVKQVIKDFVHAAKNGMEASFDGMEHTEPTANFFHKVSFRAENHTKSI